MQPLAAVFLDGPVKILNISENSLGVEGAVLLAGVFGSMTRLEQLDLTNNDLGKGTLELVSRGLPASLHTLHMGSNSIDDQSLSQIGRAFNTDTLPAFECLDLPDNNITDEGLVQFAKILETGRGLKLKTLNLVGNGFGDEGCSALAGERHAEHACMGCRVLTGIDTHVLTICRDFKNKVAGGDGAQARRK
jgi:Ran GTPase-activating protein (RanGAP) involved in mRNA processing and transport